MIYKHLSLAVGGGIIAGNRQAEQEECANVFIGLGGTGIDCLREVKKQVYNRLAPDIPGAEEPRYSHIQFLAIDSDYQALRDDCSAFALDEATECVDISCSYIYAALGNPHMLHRDPSLRWFSDDISILAADAGAGAVRQIGRLLFMMKVDTVISAIQRKIANALSGLRGNSVNIHIFTGLCGGTGSGIFLDLCYIVQKILRDMSLLGSANICGYFFLPDVNLAKVGFGIFHNYLEVNCFAAMKELDYCMNFENNGGSWDQNYKTFEIHTHQPPVNLAHLISARDEHGSILPDGYNYAMNVVVDYVMEFMTKQIVDARDSAAGYFSLRSHIANIERMVEMLNKESGACYRYHVLGASTAYIPYKDINSYLAARIFETYRTLPDTCHDIDEFVHTHGLTYKALLGEINRNVGEIPMFNVDPDELYKQVQVQGIKQPNAFPPPLDYMLGKKPEIIGNYARSRESLIQNTIVSLKNALMDISTNPTKGPVYASLLLKNVYRNDRDMTAVVEGFITENERNKAQAVATLELREQELSAALRELQNSRLRRSRKAREYTSAVHAYFTQQLRIQLYVEMGEFLMTFKRQVKDLYDNFFSPLLDTLNNVAETFRYNLEFLNEGRYVNNDYGIKLVSLDDENLRKNLDEAVDRLDTAAVVTDFVAALIKQPKKWENRNNEARISAMVSEFFVRQLSGFTSKNIDEYLADKFNAHTQEELISAIYQNVLLKLRDMATPMFWSRTVMDERCRLGYCSVPNTSGAIKAAVYQLHQVDNKIDGRISVVPDRISMLIYYCGVPMFMFKGIDQYYPVYSSEEGMTGKHIYENSSYDERDFSKLSDLIPLSLLPDDRITPEIQQFIDDYREAQEFGIIFKQSERVPYPSKYYLRKIDPEDLRQKTEAVQQLIGDNNTEKAEQFLNDPANHVLWFGETIELPNTGSDGYENRVVCDHVFASPVYTALMREQLALYRQFRESIHKLEETILC